MSAADTLPTLPPTYSSDLDILGIPAFASDLPAYSLGRTSAPVARSGARSLEKKEFHHELKKKGTPFATLTIVSEAPYSKTLPTFLEGMPIVGKVRLSLDKPELIQSVIVSVIGQVITGANQGEQLTFINILRTLWSQTEGEPRNTNPDNEDSSLAGTPEATGSSPKYTGKLQGEYTWHFSIPLPKEVVLPLGSRNEPQVFTPPATFNERHARASVAYEVSLKLTRGKLRPDQKLAGPFGYIPITRPPPFSILRQIAYQEGTAVLGPIIDPDGWFSTDPINVQVKMFNTRTIKVGCTLFLAKPLSYTRGSLIPLSLRLESSDQQALDLLSASKAIVLRLRRRIKNNWESEHALDPLSWKDTVEDSQLAVWWPSAEKPDASSIPTRFVNGELHLRSDVKPSSAMANFRIEYSVVLFPFDSAGAVILHADPLIHQQVDIVTAFAPGPRPRMSAPPGYESDSAITAPSTFNISLGSAFVG
ncbi:hypothetical protein CPB84DRAFT_1845157 [Gymnopilus junonius]|uniref:Arrestin-like N-terminal domain-containing protein n=1 Tax=Gymnopilus junonius TaxID=109634 RepID=A0A9P5NV01_GYMJU|nr:hypothetical protein CPB84DRAFT_1845157 [Gymnopilus junonius]